MSATAVPQTRYKLIDVAAVRELTGWSVSTLERRIAQGAFPKPVEGAGKSRKWTLAQYERWAKAREDAAENELS